MTLKNDLIASEVKQSDTKNNGMAHAQFGGFTMTLKIDKAM
jgi:hypothetical protein